MTQNNKFFLVFFFILISIKELKDIIKLFDETTQFIKKITKDDFQFMDCAQKHANQKNLEDIAEYLKMTDTKNKTVIDEIKRTLIETTRFQRKRPCQSAFFPTIVSAPRRTGKNPKKPWPNWKPGFSGAI